MIESTISSYCSNKSINPRYLLYASFQSMFVFFLPFIWTSSVLSLVGESKCLLSVPEFMSEFKVVVKPPVPELEPLTGRRWELAPRSLLDSTLTAGAFQSDGLLPEPPGAPSL